ncbi:MAG: hypothetical protein QM777_18925 [Pseudorhodoferax sp.]
MTSAAAPAIAQLAASAAPPVGAPQLVFGWISVPLLTVLILACSATVAFIGLSFTLLASRADTFRNLRVGFNALRASMPARFWTLTEMPEPAQFAQLVKYWQYAFDEWVITRELNPIVFGRLWRAYYRDVIRVSCKSPVMVVALFQAAEGATAPVDFKFIALVLGPRFTEPGVLARAKELAQQHRIAVPAGCP